MCALNRTHLQVLLRFLIVLSQFEMVTLLFFSSYFNLELFDDCDKIKIQMIVNFLNWGIKVELSGCPPICCPPQMDFFLLCGI